MAAMMAARMVARLAGPLPVRLVEVSSLNVVSLMWWCASMDQCSRTRRARAGVLACALGRLVAAETGSRGGLPGGASCVSMAPADQAGQVWRAGVRAGQAGDGVDGLAGGPAGGGVLPPAGDLDGLAGVREVQAADMGGLQGAGLRRLRPCPLSRAELPAGTCRQGRALTRVSPCAVPELAQWL